MAVPTVTSVTPSTGPYQGGTTVLIAGTGFVGTTAVTFGGVAGDFELSSAILLAVTSPSHLAGAAQVVVRNADGPSTDVVNFTYTAPAAAPITYVGTLTSDLDLVRFNIGDTVSGSGPKPMDGNFTDAELAGLLAIEGTWQRATAAAFETLAGLWAKHVTFSAQGMQAIQSDVSKACRLSGLEWRARYGGGPTSGSQAVIRADGYSDDLDNLTMD